MNKESINNKRLSAVILIFVVMIVTMTACGGGTDAEKSASSSYTSDAVDVPESEIAAKVGNSVITKRMGDKYSIISTYMYGYDPASLNDAAKDALLDQLIDSYVIYEYYKNKGLEPLDAAYEADAAMFVQVAKEQYPDFIKEYGVSDQDLEEFYKSQFMSKTLFTEIESEYSETDMTANAYNYYTSHQDQYVAEDGTGIKNFEEVLQDVYAQLYAQYYEEKLSDIKKTVSVDKRG